MRAPEEKERKRVKCARKEGEMAVGARNSPLNRAKIFGPEEG
jgi:hypothetical protein